MANPEHLAKLKEGVEAWNKWRGENPNIEPDLIRANLDKISFGGANFTKTKLMGADLKDSNLMSVNLVGADLRNAKLLRSVLTLSKISDANLTYANLMGVNLSDANLSQAILRGVNLVGANLFGADLLNVDLSNVIVGNTLLLNIDLSVVNGLETVHHRSPSTIGIDTLYRSQGKISDAFLKGCGVPDQMITYARSLTATPIHYYSCFISYSHHDNELAKRIHNDFQASGVRCWFAPHDMKIGDKIRPTIDESIRVYDKLLLILSEYSVQSDWVEHEVEYALERERVEKTNILFPVRMDEAVMNSTTGWAGNVKRQRHIGDFSQWKDHDAYKAAFERLLRDLTNARCGIGR